MKQEPISCRADNALAARCQSFAARWACVLKRPIFYLAAYIDNNKPLVFFTKAADHNCYQFTDLILTKMSTKQFTIEYILITMQYILLLWLP